LRRTQLNGCTWLAEKVYPIRFFQKIEKFVKVFVCVSRQLRITIKMNANFPTTFSQFLWLHFHNSYVYIYTNLLTIFRQFFWLFFTNLLTIFHKSSNYISQMLWLHFETSYDYFYTNLSATFHKSFDYISQIFQLHFTNLPTTFHNYFDPISTNINTIGPKSSAKRLNTAYGNGLTHFAPKI
jgi:hypothetical protein